MCIRDRYYSFDIKRFPSSSVPFFNSIWGTLTDFGFAEYRSIGPGVISLGICPRPANNHNGIYLIHSTVKNDVSFDLYTYGESFILLLSYNAINMSIKFGFKVTCVTQVTFFHRLSSVIRGVSFVNIFFSKTSGPIFTKFGMQYLYAKETRNLMTPNSKRR